MMKSKLQAFLVAVLTMVTGSASAAVIVTQAADVNSVFRSAIFDGISGSLLNYTEGGLIVSVNDTQCCFSSQHYGSGGNNDYVTITTPEGLDFAVLQVDVGSGFGVAAHNIAWQTLRDGNITGSGLITATPSIGYSPPNHAFATYSWSDVNLFDTLLIGAAPTSNNYTALGQYQAVALDNLQIDLGTPVPGPAPLALLAAGLIGLATFRRKQ